MKVVLTGGGSGGHITPLMVVAEKLRDIAPKINIIYIGQKGDDLAYVGAKNPNVDKSYLVRAGKFRRYHGDGLKQLLNVSTMVQNLRDLVYAVTGLVQSYLLIRKLKPDVVFSRGGYVSVPVCLGAKLNGVSYITHESDPIPSLTNRILAPWAKYKLVATSKEVYPKESTNVIVSGIPISKSYVRVTPELVKNYRQKLNIDQSSKLIFVIGGGQGAKEINDAVAEVLPNILAQFEDLNVVQVAGRKNYEEVNETYDKELDPGQRSRVKVLDFTDQVYLYSGAADIVITRAGATNLAEFEAQGVPCIIIPSSFLVAGHQLVLAEAIAKSKAAVIINDKYLSENPHILAKEIADLLNSSSKRQLLAKEINSFAHPNAADQIAQLILGTGGHK